jgi:hypothetical protein
MLPRLALNSWSHVIFLTLPSEQLGLQVHVTMPGYLLLILLLLWLLFSVPWGRVKRRALQMPGVLPLSYVCSQPHVFFFFFLSFSSFGLLRQGLAMKPRLALNLISYCFCVLARVLGLQARTTLPGFLILKGIKFSKILKFENHHLRDII